MEIKVTTYLEHEKYIKLFRDGDINLLVVTGPAGTQKTTLAKKIIKDNAVTITTHTTPFGLYRQLYHHRNENLILDDVDHIHKDKQMVRLLKALTDSTEVRIMGWHTAAAVFGEDAENNDDDNDTLPTQFETKSRCLIISNDWEALNAHVRALNDRGIVVHFHPSNIEIHKRVKEWFADQEVYHFIEQNLGFIKHLSMRNYVEAAKMKNAKKVKIDWKQALFNHWKVDDKLAAVARLLRDGKQTQNERINRFYRMTGGSRATYFRKVEEVRGIVGNDETLRLGADGQKVSKSHGSGNGAQHH
jgi:hypothetical protein